MTTYSEDFVKVDTLARRLFKVLALRGIGFGVREYDDLTAGQKEVYRNDARMLLLMEATEEGGG